MGFEVADPKTNFGLVEGLFFARFFRGAYLQHYCLHL